MNNSSKNHSSISEFQQKASGMYSPSTSYNYSPAGNSPFINPINPQKKNMPAKSQKNQQNKNQQGKNQQAKKQKHRDNHGVHFDRLIKQNDVIIRLLKEIKERLPEPPKPAQSNKNKDSQKKVSAVENDRGPEEEEAQDIAPSASDACVSEAAKEVDVQCEEKLSDTEEPSSEPSESAAEQMADDEEVPAEAGAEKK